MIAVICGLVLVCAQTAFASGYGDPCDGYFKSLINECHEVGHPTVKDKMEVGLGLDIPLYKSDKLIVDQETKIDLNAGDFGDFEKSNIGTYTVFKPQLEEGILQTAWKKIASIFNRGE
jgi:hypothetical protein